MTRLVTPQRLRAAGPWLWSGAMALLVTAPLLLSRGFALTHDMVFVPRQPFKDAWLGLDGSVPRAVPIDAIVSLLSVVVPGDILQKLVIFGLLALAGGGAAAAVPGSGLPGKLAASTLYVWNPYVFERLAMGQWALLCGYAALPWVLVAAMRVRSGRALGWPLLCLALAAAGFTSPTGGVLAGLLCCCVLVGRRAAATWRALALSLVVNLPWIVPSLLYRGGIPADPDGVSAFAARSDTPYGVLGSLASLGGMWNTDVVPPGRDSWFLAGLLLLVSLAAIVGVTWSSEVTGGLPVRRLVVVGLIGLVLAAAAALPGGLAVMQWADVHLPGAGLLRDSQKWVALLALVEAIGLAALVTRLGRRLSRYGAQATWWLLAVAVFVPVAALPALAWGLAGRLQPVDYPRDWAEVSGLLDGYESSGMRGDVAVLPWSIYRQYPWNDNRPVLDPAPRYFPGRVVIADTLVVGPHAVGGEDRRAAQVGALLARGGNVTEGLRRLGIGIVVEENHTPGIGQEATVHGTLAFDGRWLRLWLLAPPASGPASPGTPTLVAILVGDAVAAGAFLTSLGLVTWAGWRRYTGQ